MALANRDLGAVVAELAAVIVAHKAWLSELDGRIGDGDHGANMAKGFARAADRVAGQDLTLGAALAILSDVLMGEIGGSMGPLYGVMFDDMAQALEGCSRSSRHEPKKLPPRLPRRARGRRLWEFDLQRCNERVGAGRRSTARFRRGPAAQARGVAPLLGSAWRGGPGPHPRG